MFRVSILRQTTNVTKPAEAYLLKNDRLLAAKEKRKFTYPLYKIKKTK
tara:strand:+ start:500 stop:643 length:144 start_codon:yes stop_codon:yes gene_type:complete